MINEREHGEVSPSDLETQLERIGSRRQASSTLTRAHLSKAVYQTSHVTNKEAAHLVDMVLEQIIRELCRGNEVKLHLFGRFTVRQKRQRMGRNPRTMAPSEISARRIVLFTASRELKKRIAGVQPGAGLQFHASETSSEQNNLPFRRSY